MGRRSPPDGVVPLGPGIASLCLMAANTPSGSPSDTPDESPVETPDETQVESPIEAPSEAPSETPPEAPVETPDVEALKARVKELESQLAAAPPPTVAIPVTAEAAPRSHRGWRMTAVAVMLALAFVLAPLSVVAQWAHSQIGDTDRYVETVTPLADDPAVQKAIGDRVTSEIVNGVNVQGLTSDVLTALSGQSFVPSRAADILPSLSVPLSNAIEQFINDKVNEFVASDTFKELWIEANREAHQQMVGVLTGDTGKTVEVKDNAVSINIAPFIEATKQRLVDNGFSFAQRIPEVNATFMIFQSDDLGKAQHAFALLDTLATVLPILVILLVLGAVWVSPSRRRTWIAAGLGVAISMVVLGLSLNLARPFYLDAIPSDAIPASAAAAIYDDLTAYLRIALRAVLVTSLAIAIAALLMAPSGAGAAVRHGIGGGVRRLRESAAGAGMDTGPVGTFLGRYRTFARVVIVSVGALVYLAVDYPTVTTSLVVIIAIVLLLVLLEFLAVPPAEEPAVLEGAAGSADAADVDEAAAAP